FNAAHGITPIGVVKRIKDLIDGVQSDKASEQAQRNELARVQQAEIEDMSEKDLARELKRLEKLMFEHARKLEFEQAAQARDRLTQLKDRVLGAHTPL
ncbi:MAG: UvrB/UvrC motif-containing protein, partial [Serpentinimonas sp.]|nr:UvrB/UvrC motif-containing protein [Serpentinimonas sp.]